MAGELRPLTERVLARLRARGGGGLLRGVTWFLLGVALWTFLWVYVARASPPDGASGRRRRRRRGATTTRHHRTEMTAKQARAAELLGRGLSCRATARELGVSERTITHYRRLPGFSAAERRAHAERVGEVVGIRGVLEQALYAVKRDGTPDFQTRLKAAALLLGAPPEEPDPSQPVVIR